MAKSETKQNDPVEAKKQAPAKKKAAPKAPAEDKAMAKAEPKAKTKAKAKTTGKEQSKAAPKGEAKSSPKPEAKTAPQQPAKAKAKGAAKAKAGKQYVPRLKQQYIDKIRPDLMRRLNYDNIWQVPRVNKIVLNMGLGLAREDANMLKGALSDLAVISGQKALVTYAKKPISNFKLRANDPVGAKVTLRRNRMYEFLDRLLSLAVPRVRDFRGLSDRSFDGRGNYSMGVTEQIIFPEIDYDKLDQIRGLDITVVTTAATDQEAFELLHAMGFPFRIRPQTQPTTEGASA